MESISSLGTTPPSPPDSIEPDHRAIATHNAIKELDGRAFWDRVVMITGIFVLIVFLFEPANRVWRSVFKIPEAITQTKKQVDKAIDWIAPDFTKSPEVGDVVSGYRVTSQFGPRKSPTGGGNIEGHGGVDLATPVGTLLFAPADSNIQVLVKCKFQANGAGLYAEVTSPQYPEYVFQLMHLDKCFKKPGEQDYIQGGTAFARTGGQPGNPNAGRSTGPHLHISQLKNGQRVPPQKIFIMYFLDGKVPSAAIERNKDTIEKEGVKNENQQQ